MSNTGGLGIYEAHAFCLRIGFALREFPSWTVTLAAVMRSRPWPGSVCQPVVPAACQIVLIAERSGPTSRALERVVAYNARVIQPVLIDSEDAIGPGQRSSWLWILAV